MIYKALTILEPWASLIACGAKKVETRSWPTKYRGPIAIHAGKRINQESAFLNPIYSTLMTADLDPNKASSLSPGKVIAIAELKYCLQINESHVHYLKEDQANGVNNEYAFGDYTLGRYAWVLANVRRIEPIPAKGLQRIWDWEADENELHFR